LFNYFSAYYSVIIELAVRFITELKAFILKRTKYISYSPYELLVMNRELSEQKHKKGNQEKGLGCLLLDNP